MHLAMTSTRTGGRFPVGGTGKVRPVRFLILSIRARDILQRHPLASFRTSNANTNPILSRWLYFGILNKFFTEGFMNSSVNLVQERYVETAKFVRKGVGVEGGWVAWNACIDWIILAERSRFLWKEWIVSESVLTSGSHQRPSLKRRSPGLSGFRKIHISHWTQLALNPENWTQVVNGRIVPFYLRHLLKACL